MKIHEYQAKEILAKYGVAVPKGEVANTLEEANDVARKLFAEGATGVVVKAQIHAGGRGKGGGVKVARTREDAELHAKNILGMQLVTHQTGPEGQKVQRLLVEETAAIDRELYLGIVLDRATGKLVFMASQACLLYTSFAAALLGAPPLAVLLVCGGAMLAIAWVRRCLLYTSPMDAMP